MIEEVKMHNSKFIYVVNEYVGGCPMDSQCHGVFTTMEKAKKYFHSYIKEITQGDEEFKENIIYDNEDNPLNDSSSCFWDMDDFFGGIEITAVKLNR